MINRRVFVLYLVILSCLLMTTPFCNCETKRADPSLLEKIGFHKAVYDADGKLLPWKSWDSGPCKGKWDWYLNCPLDSHGYPIFVFTTFMDENYKSYRTDTIPCTQLGMGIISYLKYFKYTGRADPKVLKWAPTYGRLSCKRDTHS